MRRQWIASYEFSMGGKWLELLKEIAPGVKRAALAFNPGRSVCRTNPARNWRRSARCQSSRSRLLLMIWPVARTRRSAEGLPGYAGVEVPTRSWNDALMSEGFK